MIGRRGFLKCIGLGVLGMALSLRAPEKVTLSEPMSVEFALTSSMKDLFNPPSDLHERYIRPAAQAMADKMDADIAAWFSR